MNWNLAFKDDYNLVMKVANNKKLMWIFKDMLVQHLDRHRENKLDPNVDREDCEFCLIILNW